MIIVRLKGGLGNQLFQYAAGYSLAKKNGCNLLVDATSFEGQDASNNFTYRRADILNLNISSAVASKKLIETHRNRYGFMSKIFRYVNQKFLKRYYIGWHPKVMKKKSGSYLEGYFQSENYFMDYRVNIEHEFVLLESKQKNILSLKDKIKNSKNSVGVHVRRGDYVSNIKNAKLHDVCGSFYFESALKKMYCLIGNHQLFIFSDDVEWVKKNLDFPVDATYVSGLYGDEKRIISDVEELILMTMCKNMIISNSTFSWWGAYLNKNLKPIIMAPSEWVRSDASRNLIIPNGWIKINTQKI